MSRRPVSDGAELYRYLMPDATKPITGADAQPLSGADDVFPNLVKVLAADVCTERRVPVREFAPAALTLMRALPWRRNLAELRDVIVQLMTAGRLGDVRLEEILEHVRIEGHGASQPIQTNLKAARLSFERDYIRTVLERHGWRISDAARTLGIQRPNLYRKARQLGILRRPVRTR
jgi:DNA-binding NtrC family response regulator